VRAIASEKDTERCRNTLAKEETLFLVLVLISLDLEGHFPVEIVSVSLSAPYAWHARK
jgi:hypothetical protein